MRTDTKQKYSVLTRMVCGVLGLLGVAAIGFNAVQDGAIQPNFMLFAKMLAGFVFLYVAIVGISPLDMRSHDDDGNRK